MEKAVKNFLYAGVELAAETSEKMEKSISDAVTRGTFNKERGKEMVDNLFTNTKKTRKEFDKNLNKVKDWLGFQDRDERELAKLRKRVVEIETKLKSNEKLEAPEAKPTQSKPVAAKHVEFKKVENETKPVSKPSVQAKPVDRAPKIQVSEKKVNKTEVTAKSPRARVSKTTGKAKRATSTKVL